MMKESNPDELLQLQGSVTHLGDGLSYRYTTERDRLGAENRVRGSSLRISLLRRLQTWTLTDATPPTGKINPFSKMAMTFEPIMGFGCPSGFRKFLIMIT